MNVIATPAQVVTPPIDTVVIRLSYTEAQRLLDLLRDHEGGLAYPRLCEALQAQGVQKDDGSFRRNGGIIDVHPFGPGLRH